MTMREVHNRKVAFHTLGCKVNQYETEALKSQFEDAGFSIVDEDHEAQVYVINTCTVTHLADRKSRQYIRKMKKKAPDSIIAVTGCYAQVNPEEVMDISEVDMVVGTNEKQNLVQMVMESFQFPEKKVKRVRDYRELKEFIDFGKVESLECRSRAYVKIQEGCNRFCSYCIIPYARGPVRSRKPEAIIEECKSLLEKGFKEIVLTGINTALCNCLLKVLDTLDNMEGDFRVRLSSLEPNVADEDFVKKLFSYRRLCHHLHLSMQSGSDAVLKRMNRRYTGKDYLNILNTLKKFDPLYGITTDIIVGFPGETETDFYRTLDIIRKGDFCGVHGFKYSRRKGTSAALMEEQISDYVKAERMKALLQMSEKSHNRFIEKNIGKDVTVLFEEYDDNQAILSGYTDNYIRAYIAADRFFVDSAEPWRNKLVTTVIKGPFLDGVEVVRKL